MRGRKCTPCFPVRKGGSERALSNARHWAIKSIHWNYRYTREAEKLRGRLAEVQPVEVDNIPRSGFRIVAAEQRGEGGRAWKVLTPDGDLVDLREDVFLPILLKKGLPASGIIDAEFQWCQNGSQLRLEEVGSKQHSRYIPGAERARAQAKAKEEATSRAKAKKAATIKVKDLKVGYLYEGTSYGCRLSLVYLGRVRYDGKLKTAWMSEHRLRDLWLAAPRDGVMGTGSLVTRCVGPVPGKDKFLGSLEEFKKKIFYWQRFDGLPVGYTKANREGTFDPEKLEWM